MAKPDLLQHTSRGLYCPQADIYIDPWKKVPRAVITHAHADHARPGHTHYLCHHRTAPLLRHRLGKRLSIQSLDWGQAVLINGVRVSLHSAGHILGSAQVRLEYQGEVWVVSGDYKLEDDGLTTPFESVKCNVFITESTFALPVYRWKPQATVFEGINQWWANNRAKQIPTIIFGYSLGKSQRILAGLDHSIGPVYVHEVVGKTNAVIREAVCALPETKNLHPGTKPKDLAGALVMIPPGIRSKGQFSNLDEGETGAASGWMALRSKRGMMRADRGFVLSDHADWEGIVAAIKATGAERVITTHGYATALASWLQSQGIASHTAETRFEGEPE